MKKIVMLMILVLALLLPAAAANQEKKDEGKAPATAEKVVIKTYQLKYANPRDIYMLIGPFVMERQFNETTKFLVVKILPENIKGLEDMLAKIDVEKKTVALRIFTIIASMKPAAVSLDQPDLKGVVDELRNVLGYKSYSLDGVSSINLLDGTEGQIQLNSSVEGLTLVLNRISIDTPQSGPRKVRFDLRLRTTQAGIILPKDSTIISNYLLESDTQINENGYLVAGVSKLAKSGDALVLIINAVIK